MIRAVVRVDCCLVGRDEDVFVVIQHGRPRPVEGASQQEALVDDSWKQIEGISIANNSQRRSK